MGLISPSHLFSLLQHSLASRDGGDGGRSHLKTTYRAETQLTQPSRPRGDQQCPAQAPRVRVPLPPALLGARRRGRGLRRSRVSYGPGRLAQPPRGDAGSLLHPRPQDFRRPRSGGSVSSGSTSSRAPSPPRRLRASLPGLSLSCTECYFVTVKKNKCKGTPKP